jgi:hypothetical protein
MEVISEETFFGRNTLTVSSSAILECLGNVPVGHHEKSYLIDWAQIYRKGDILAQKTPV